MNETRYIKFESQEKQAEDCSVRAIMKLTNKTWEECFDELCAIARNNKRMPNEWKVIENWLTNNNYKKCSFGKLKKGEHRMNVAEFVVKNNKGKYLLNTWGHVIACVDGYYYDSWDCGNAKIYNYYKLEEK